MHLPAAARRAGYRPMVVVLDASGHLGGAARRRRQHVQVDVATGKTWAAIGIGAASRAAQRARQPELLRHPRRDGGRSCRDRRGADQGRTGAVLGGVSASGTGGEDEAICIAGVQSAGLVHG
jgi:uncharacterized protein GlcG (DUF336 family)